MAGTIYCRPVGKGSATDGLANPHRLRRSVEQFFFFQKRAKREDATRFQCQSIDTSVRELPQKENERAISEDFPAADVYGNLVSLFKNLEGKPIS